MRWQIVTALLVCLLLVGGAPKRDLPKGTPQVAYPAAKVELKGRLEWGGHLPGARGRALVINVGQLYELDLSKLKVPPKKEMLEKLVDNLPDGTTVVVHGILIQPHEIFGTVGNLPKTPLVIVKKLMVVYE